MNVFNVSVESHVGGIKSESYVVARNAKSAIQAVLKKLPEPVKGLENDGMEVRCFPTLEGVVVGGAK